MILVFDVFVKGEVAKNDTNCQNHTRPVVSLLALLTAEDALHQLVIREVRLTGQIASLAGEMRATSLPKLYSPEAEYLRTVLKAELKWVVAVLLVIGLGECLLWGVP
jgi:hypothetical protein